MESVADVLEGRRVCICAGSGGVGKTTTSAAIAMGMAARGLTVAVVTIDPAKRLATSLGLEKLENDPQKIARERFAEHGLEMQGELWAMTLDSKRTFDALIERLAPDQKSAEEVLENRIYQQLSSAVAGSQEFTAVAKLYELDQSGQFDLIVLDTPPSRNALDFLDAPDRLTGFFQGRAVRMFLRPAGIGGRLLGAGTGMVLGVMKRVTGVDLMEDLSVFFKALGSLIDGFTERADGVKKLLADPGTIFLLVSSPEHEPVAEAIYFRRQLAATQMPFGGLIVNRVNVAPPSVTVDDELRSALGEQLADKVEAALGDVDGLATRDADNLERLDRELDRPPTLLVPQLPSDVHDVDGLLAIGAYLFGDQAITRAA